MLLLDKILPRIFVHIRPFVKLFIHTFTRRSELQRMCYGTRPGASRTRQVERCLSLSQQPEIKQLLRELDATAEYCNEEELMQFPAKAVAVVQRAKNINARIHPAFAGLFGACCLNIWSYKNVVHQIEKLRAEAYDCKNSEHEQKLIELWNLLMPEQGLSGRISKQWQEIGFQGDDPKTDFRGIGILGLESLLFFAKNYKFAAHHVLLHSMHPTLGYNFALVGIDLTAMAYRLVINGDAKTHFYNKAQANKQPCTLIDFHKFCSYLLFEFDRFWFESEPTNIMDFFEIYKKFNTTIMESLQKDTTLFKTSLVVADNDFTE